MLVTMTDQRLSQDLSQEAICEVSGLDVDLWPNIIGLETGDSPLKRTSVGPLSVKFSLRGAEVFDINGKIKRVDRGCYLITNAGEPYTSEINDTTQSVSVFFNHEFVKHAVDTSIKSDTWLLEHVHPDQEDIGTFPSKLYLHDNLITPILQDITLMMKSRSHDINCFNNIFLSLIDNLISLKSRIQKRMDRIPLKNKATREELFKRVNLAADMILSDYSNSSIDLQQIAEEACLSKFYLIKSFTKIFGQTPYNFLVHKRMCVAREMLSEKKYTLKEISSEIGYDDHSSFSRTFRRIHSVYPSEYAKACGRKKTIFSCYTDS